MKGTTVPFKDTQHYILPFPISLVHKANISNHTDSELQPLITPPPAQRVHSSCTPRAAPGEKWEVTGIRQRLLSHCQA
jgi:hypothetical protein